jgi:hypothetical protein
MREPATMASGDEAAAIRRVGISTQLRGSVGLFAVGQHAELGQMVAALGFVAGCRSPRRSTPDDTTPLVFVADPRKRNPAPVIPTSRCRACQGVCAGGGDVGGGSGL